jgi:F420H(2)-dependent quinone reductase
MGNFLMRLVTGLHAKMIKLTRGKLLAGSAAVLAHKGAKSGKVRETPVMCFRDGDRYMIVASAGGAVHHPGWYHNLMANPETTIYVDGKTIPVTARDAGEARDELWQTVVAEDHRFAAYVDKTDRVIPIVILEPR